MNKQKERPHSGDALSVVWKWLLEKHPGSQGKIR